MFDGDSYEAFGKWRKDHHIYPRKALELGPEGRVSISFTIAEDGKSVDVKSLELYIHIPCNLETSGTAHAQQPPNLQALPHIRVHPKKHPNI